MEIGRLNGLELHYVRYALTADVQGRNLFRLAQETEGSHFSCSSISESAASKSRVSLVPSSYALRRRSASDSQISSTSSSLPGSRLSIRQSRAVTRIGQKVRQDSKGLDLRYGLFHQVHIIAS